MTRMMLFASCLVLAGAGAALGQGGTGDEDRYVISEVEGGILRVDRLTGAVSHCGAAGGEWVCQLIPDDRDAMQRVIAELEDENRRLRRRLAEYDPEAANRVYGYRAEPEDDMGGSDGLMTKEEVDEAMDTLEYMMDRFIGAADKYAPQQGVPR